MAIPAHLGSKRLKKKLLINILGLPIIEHVRRRAYLSKAFDEIFIITPDLKIKKIIENFGGKVILSKKKHNSGTSRVSEILTKLKCERIVILFGDELLIDPKVLKNFTEIINKDKKSSVWNATSKKINKKEILESSIVKCFIDNNGYIKKLSRRVETKKRTNKINKYKILKSVGILAYKKIALLELSCIKSSKNEKSHKIEQIKIIENSFSLKSVPVNFNYPSINTKKELNTCLNILKKDKLQKRILEKLLKL